jgi:hypothetical protein
VIWTANCDKQSSLLSGSSREFIRQKVTFEKLMLSDLHPPDSIEFISIVSTGLLKIQTPKKLLNPVQRCRAWNYLSQTEAISQNNYPSVQFSIVCCEMKYRRDSYKSRGQSREQPHELVSRAHCQCSSSLLFPSGSGVVFPCPRQPPPVGDAHMWLP